MIDLKQREIRVFLSSTFRDMDAERTHLVKEVFPKVRAVCQARQVGFTEIDLRWGVTEEESKNGATVEIRLKEIDRCRDFPPFFIGFLGERYGWLPSHDEFFNQNNSFYCKLISVLCIVVFLEIYPVQNSNERLPRVLITILLSTLSLPIAYPVESVCDYR